MAEEGIIDLDVQCTRPRRVAKNGSELVLVVGLGHEDMGAT
jgi:hypothetical protein